MISAMAFGVYCDRMPRPDIVSQVVLSTTSTGYDLTHQFLALQYMRQNGCLSATEEEVLTLAAEKIAAEQQRDPEFSDLWAERLAVLLYGDYRRLVETSWIDALIAKQEPSGAWSDPKFPRRFYRRPRIRAPRFSRCGRWPSTAAPARFARSLATERRGAAAARGTATRVRMQRAARAAA